MTPITNGQSNQDRIGQNGRLRYDFEWDTQQQTFVGGESTPASDISEATGDLVLARFASEGNDTDELQNHVILPDDSTVNGNKLLRGTTAQTIPHAQKEGVAARGKDVVALILAVTILCSPKQLLKQTELLFSKRL